MARSLRDKYAQKNKGKVSIAGRGTVNRTSSTAAGKKYTVNQKNKVKEDTKKYFTVSRAKDKDYQQSKNSWQDGTKTYASKIGAKSTTKNLSTTNLYEEGKRKQQAESKPKTVNNQQITTGKNKGRYWTDIAGKKKTNQNITPISDPTQSGDYLFVNQTQEKYPGTRKNLLQSQIDSNTQSISDKYKPIQEELKEEKRKANEQYENNREEALNQLHSAQYLGSLAEQNPEMNGAQEAAQEANKNLAQSQRNVATSEAAQKTAHDITSQEQQVNIARKDEIDKSNQEIYKQEAQSGDITQKAKQGEEINDKLNTFEDKEAQKYMTEDEKQIYNALKTTSVGTAHGYYKSIQNELFDRQAQAQYEKDILTDELVANNIAQMDDSPIKDIVQFAYDKGRELQRGGTTAVSALRRWGKDVSNLPAALTGSDDVLYETAIEKYHQYQRADMEGLEAVVNDVLDSVVYQLPNMGMAAATGGASLAVNTGMVFATSFSSSYTQAIQEGYAPDTAQAFALANGLSEAGTTFFLKGVSFAGKGILPQVFSNKTAATSFKTIIADFLKDMGSEGAEEALQEILGTIIGNNVLGKNDKINWVNVAYAGVLGSISAGIMNGTQLSTNPLVQEAQLKVRGEKAAEMNTESAQLYRENIESIIEEARDILPENNKNIKALEGLNRDIQRGKNIPDERVNEVCGNATKELRDTAVKESINETVSELEKINNEAQNLNTQIDRITSMIDEYENQKELLMERAEAGEISQNRANLQIRTVNSQIEKLNNQSLELENRLSAIQDEAATGEKTKHAQEQMTNTENTTAENNAIVAENANTTQTENVTHSQQSEDLTQGQQRAVEYGRPAVNEDGSINAGRVTTIKSPYTGEVPTQNKSNAQSKINVEQSSVDTARARIEEAQTRNKNGEKRSVRGILTSLYKGIFGDKFKNGVKVDGMSMNNADYIVSVGNKVLNKVINDPNITAEKLSVLDKLQEVIQSAEYLGSADYGKENANRKVHTVRYDYFENEVNIGGRDYTVSFDVQALRDRNNNFRTYKIDEIKISETRSADVAPVATATENRLLNDVNISNENITQNTPDVKREIKKGDEVVHTKYKYGGTGKGKVVSIKNGKVKIKFGYSGVKVFSIKNLENGIIQKASEIEQKPRTIEELEPRTIEELEAAEDVSTGTKATQDRRSIPEKIKDFGGWIYRGLTDTQDSVAKISTDINYQVNAVRGATSRADANIGVLPHAKNLTQTNIWGQRKEGTQTLTKIFEPINSAGKDKRVLFDKYMYHKLNISRYEAAGKTKTALDNLIEDRNGTYRQYPNVKNQVEAYKNNKLSYNELSEGGKLWVDLDRKIEQLQDLARYKPVFGDTVSLEESKAFVDKYASDKLFTDTEKQLRGYLDNLVQARVDAGNISSDFASYLSGKNAIYDNYIPAYYSNKGMTMENIFEDAEQDTAVGKTVSRAQGAGSGDVLMDLEDAIAKQTRAVFTEGNINLLMNNLTNQIKQNPTYKGKYSDKPFVQKNGNQSHDILYYDKGTPKHLYVSDDIFVGIDGLSKTMKSNALLKVVSATNNVFKKSITEWNPVFLARNFIKDFSDGVWYTKFGMKNFVKNWGKAVQEIAKQGDYYSVYMNSGAAMGSFFSNYSGNTIEGKTSLTSNKNLLQKGVDKISMANFAVELAPRLSEFISTIEAHGMNANNVTSDVLMEAIYNANEVTTNFGRSGAAGKYINKIVPFFNPSVQGFDKAIRQLKGENGSKFSAKRLASVLVKGTMIGLAPAMLQEILIASLGDDDDKEMYYSMSDYTKNNYYIVFTGKGNYVKIPKGRVTGIFGNVGRGIVQDVRAATSGKKYNSTDWTALWDSAVNNVAPTNPFENAFGIGIARVLIGQGTDWKGYEIESDDDQKLPVADRYDEDTSPIAMWLSRNLGLANFGLSPKKIDVLIDEQGGVFGDIALPLSQRMSTGDINGVTDIGKILLDVSGFTGNAYESNARSGQVYNLKNELETQINHDNLVNGESNIKSVDQLVLDFINDTQGSVYDNKDKIAQAKISGDMSQDDIQKLNRELSKENTETNTAILANIDGFREKVSKYYDKYITDNMTEEQKKQGVKTAYLQAYAETLGADLAVKNTLSDDSYSEYKQTGASADGYYKYLVGSYGLSAASENGKATETDKKTMLNSLGLNSKDIKGIWQTEFEDKNTDEKRTIAYAEKIGVSPKNFLQWQVQYANTKGEVDTESAPSESLYYENGKLIKDEDNPGTVSGSKKQKDCQNLLNSGYSDKEKDYFFQMAYSSDNKYAQARSDGISADAYLQYMADGTNNLKADKDDNGKSISGSKKAKVLRYIANMDISDEHKIYFATVIAGYKIDGISTIMQYSDYKDGSKTGSGGKGRRRSGGRGRASGGGTAISPKKLAQSLLAIQKKSRAKPTATSNGLKSLSLSLGKQDTIKQKTKAQELLAIDNNPLYTSAMKNKLKKSINARYS